MTFHDSRIARVARFIAARLDNEKEIRLYIHSEYADNKVFRIMVYLNRYIGKYGIEYPGNGTAIIRQYRG